MNADEAMQPLIHSDSRSHQIALVVCVAILCYLSAQLGGTLMIKPEMIWPLWPGCAFLVAVLLVTSRKAWPALLISGIGGFVIYDLQAGLPIRSIILLVLSDTAEILIASFGIRYSLGSSPHVNSFSSLAKFSLFAGILAPTAAATVGGLAVAPDYWMSWRISFLTEGLALLTLTPAILSWVDAAVTPIQRPRTMYIEAAVIASGLVALGYFTFVEPGANSRPALLYSLVPLLLWAALRFGVIGISTSMLIIAFLSIRGVTHGNGPFAGSTPTHNVLSLQMFFLFAAASFTVLAVLGEERKLAAQQLRESETRFRLVANAAPVLIWMSGPDKKCTYFNEPWLRFTGRSQEQEFGNGWSDGVYPEDLERCLAIYTRAFDNREHFGMEYRLRRHDGEYRWILDLGVPRFDPDGAFEGYIGSCIDVTERKLAEEALSNVSRRLIQAQEQERSRIARDLHDDITQRLVLLAIEIGELKEKAPGFSAEAEKHINDLQDVAKEISATIQTMSHELHSSRLEYLGLGPAVQSFCKEFSERQKTEVELTIRDIPASMPLEVSLSLFRVAQEALHNAARHSGVKHFKVQLWRDSGQIHLSVSDLGMGFDIADAKQGTGLGLVSMQERLRLLNGALAIDSQSKRGTTIHASVPFDDRSDSARAAG